MATQLNNMFEFLFSLSKDAIELDDAKAATTLECVEMQFNFQKTCFEHIQNLVEIRKDLESRIVAILSDYTMMINQVALVSTLTLAMALGAFGSLLGNTDDQTEWKIILFTISCVVTICLSTMSVIESFFLAIHINQVEARFAGGVYPHIAEKSGRMFNSDEMRNLNSKFNFIVITFFSSFFSFSMTILGTAYIGLGLSENVFLPDKRMYKQGDSFLKNSVPVYTPLSDSETGFVPAASIASIVVICTYIFILGRFLTTYSMHIHARSLIRFFLINGCIKTDNHINKRVTHNLSVPIIHAAKRFNSIQKAVTKEAKNWIIATEETLKFIQDCSKEGQDNVLKKNKLNRLKMESIPELPNLGNYTIGNVNNDKTDEGGFDNDFEEVVEGINEVFVEFGSYVDLSIRVMTQTVFRSQHDKWKQNRYVKRVTKCLHYSKLLAKNINILTQYSFAEKGYVPEPLNFQLQPWPRAMTAALVLWSITGGLAVIIVSFIAASLWSIFTCGSCENKFRASSIALWHVNNIGDGFNWIAKITHTYVVDESIEYGLTNGPNGPYWYTGTVMGRNWVNGDWVYTIRQKRGGQIKQTSDSMRKSNKYIPHDDYRNELVF
jgi:hypothetical protein